MLNSKSIGDKIAEARKARNLSQTDLADQVSISAQAVGKWERGESMPNIITLNRLAGILGVDLNYFSDRFPSTHLAAGATEPFEEPPAGLPALKRTKRLNWNMSKLNLTDGDFSGLKDLHEKFSSSNMQRCQFIGSELAGLLLKSNNVDRCDFSGSDLRSCHIKSSNLANNQFTDCSLQDTEFSGSCISGCNFTNANFTGVLFKSGGFEKNILEQAVWNHTKFEDSYLSNTVFGGTLEDCSFENCTFSKVRFEQATLLNTFFKNNKRLNRVRFIDCRADRITYAFLKNGRADLTGISLIP